MDHLSVSFIVRSSQPCCLEASLDLRGGGESFCVPGAETPWVEELLQMCVWVDGGWGVVLFLSEAGLECYRSSTAALSHPGGCVLQRCMLGNGEVNACTPPSPATGQW